MLRVLPVVDLLGGQAVRALAGDRAHYRPVSTHLHPGSDPLGLALAFRDRLGLRDVYLADLDAIAGRPPDRALCGSLMAGGLRLWLDPGVRSPGLARDLLGLGVPRLILSSETLDGPEALSEIVSGSGADRLVFGLDLRDGTPWLAPGSDWGTAEPWAILEIALGLGLDRFLILDVARVGRGGGVGTESLVARLRESAPESEILAGGGISGPDDLKSLETAGASAVLIGSALLDGRIGPADWA